MAEFYINIPKIKQEIKKEEEIAGQLLKIQQRLEEQLNGVGSLGHTYIPVQDALKHSLSEITEQQKEMQQFAAVLEDIVKTYENTEQRIVSYGISEGNAVEPESTEAMQEEIEEAYKDGTIDEETYKFLNSIFSGIWSFSIATLQTALMNILQDKTAEAIANAAVAWLRENTTFFMDRGLVPALAGGGEAFLSEAPSWLASLIRGGAKYGVPIAGTAIDFGMQVLGGEDAGDALVKAGAHTAIGFGGAVAGTKIGGAIGMALGSVVPGAGTVIGGIVGAVVGAGIGAAGAVAFDYVYDNWDDIVDGAGELLESAGELLESAGDAVADAFQGLGSVFG